MKFFITTATLLCLAAINATAQFRYTIHASPDSAIVRMNGQEICATPCHAEYRWKQIANNNQIVVEVSSPGYTSWLDTIIGKPHDLLQQTTVDLDLKYPDLSAIKGELPVIAFDKIVLDLPDEDKIGRVNKQDGTGENLSWRNARVSERSFQRMFYRTAGQCGLPTPFEKKARVFSDEHRLPGKPPRFILAGTVVYLNTKLRYKKPSVKSADPYTGYTELTVKWEVMDMAQGKVVLSKEEESRIARRTSKYSTEELDINSFILTLVQFFSSSEFEDLLAKTEELDFIPRSIDVDDTLAIEPVAIPNHKSSMAMIQYASNSCVTVITDAGHGSGVVIGQNGLILSAEHVVSGANTVDVLFSDGLKMGANVVRADPLNDVVLLEISGEGYQALPLAVNHDATLGEEVLTIGTPAELELGQSIAKGIVSGKRKVEGNIFIQTDMAVSPGNSGGPLLNSKGEIIGVVQRKVVAEGVEGIGFAIPINVAAEALGLRISK